MCPPWPNGSTSSGSTSSAPPAGPENIQPWWPRNTTSSASCAIALWYPLEFREQPLHRVAPGPRGARERRSALARGAAPLLVARHALHQLEEMLEVGLEEA